MGENTKIEWAHHTFNPWIGCTKVALACDNCYAADLAQARLGVQWGDAAPRRRTAESTWKQPLKWNRKAAKLCIRYRVFCASLADVFDNRVDPQWRADLFALIRATPHLDWLLVTKRVSNVQKMVDAIPGRMPENVWLGITIGTQQDWDRDVPRLKALKILYDLPVAFISMEPMLEAISTNSGLDFYQPCDNWLDENGSAPGIDPSTGMQECCSSCDWSGISDTLGIDWLIAGGESGPHARPSHIDWFRQIREDCSSARVAFLFKQWGEWFPYGCLDADGNSNSQTLGEAPGKWKEWQREGSFSVRIGKKQAGRYLDGRIHDGVPA